MMHFTLVPDISWYEDYLDGQPSRQVVRCYSLRAVLVEKTDWKLGSRLVACALGRCAYNALP